MDRPDTIGRWQIGAANGGLLVREFWTSGRAMWNTSSTQPGAGRIPAKSGCAVAGAGVRPGVRGTWRGLQRTGQIPGRDSRRPLHQPVVKISPPTQININHGPDAFKACPALHFSKESKHDNSNRI